MIYEGFLRNLCHANTYVQNTCKTQTKIERKKGGAFLSLTLKAWNCFHFGNLRFKIFILATYILFHFCVYPIFHFRC